ncbi:MAG: eight-cysteine-cluster domain-containing protein [Candidatus Aenigmatarchaeota archaeon]
MRLTRPLATAAMAIAVFAAIFASAQVQTSLPAPAGGECLVDADCSTGGCSGQICATAAEAPKIMTTCEWREEYGCLRLTTCGCVDGVCAWRNTPEYAECLANLSR